MKVTLSVYCFINQHLQDQFAHLKLSWLKHISKQICLSFHVFVHQNAICINLKWALWLLETEWIIMSLTHYFEIFQKICHSFLELPNVKRFKAFKKLHKARHRLWLHFVTENRNVQAFIGKEINTVLWA